MLFRIAKSGKNFHHVENLFLLFGPRFVEPNLLLDVKKFSADDKLLPPDSLSQLFVVNIDQSKLHLSFFLTIVFVEFHLCQKKLNIIIEFNLKVSSFRHVSHYLCWVGS